MTKSFFSRFTVMPSAITAAAAAPRPVIIVIAGGVPGSSRFHGFLVSGITRSRGGGGGASSSIGVAEGCYPYLRF